MIRTAHIFLSLSLILASSAYAYQQESDPFSIAQAEKKSMDAPDLPLPPPPGGTPEAPALPEVDMPALPAMDDDDDDRQREEERIEDEGTLMPAPAAPPALAPAPAPAAPAVTKEKQEKKEEPAAPAPPQDPQLLEKSQPFGVSKGASDAPKKQETFGDKDKNEATSTEKQCAFIPGSIIGCKPAECNQTSGESRQSYKINGMDGELCGFSYSDTALELEKDCYLTREGQAMMAEGIKTLINSGQESTNAAYTSLVARECGTKPHKDAAAPERSVGNMQAGQEDTEESDEEVKRSKQMELDLPQLESNVAVTNCNSFPGKLDRCERFKCQELSYNDEKEEYIKKRDILGLEDGMCRYQESLPDDFLLDCHLSKKMGQGFADYFRLLKTPEQASAQPDTITSYYDAMEQSCKVIGNDGKELSMSLYLSLSNLPSNITEYGPATTPQGDCETLNEKLKDCQPFYCKGFDPIQEKFFNRQVEIERKIIGKNENICYYLEQKPAGKPQGCKFATAQSSTTSQCSPAILLEMTKIEGLLGKTAAELAADLKGGVAGEAEEVAAKDPALTMWKPKWKELPKLDYQTQVLPSLIYRKQYNKPNQDLPKAMYMQDYVNMQFDALNRGDLAALKAVIDKVNFVLKKSKLEKSSPDTPRNALEVRDYNGNTLLIRSIMAGRFTVARMLLGEGANINARNNSGNTALHVAAYAGRSDMVNLLLGMGADRNVKDNYGRTALSLATEQRHSDIAKVLLMKGSDPDAIAGSGKTPLETVIAQGDAKGVIRLLKGGANVNRRGQNGVTPLMQAAAQGNAEIVDILVNSRADVFAQDGRGRTAEMYATHGGYTYIARYLASQAMDVKLQKVFAQ